MTDRLKTAFVGAALGFMAALIIFLFFRDADASIMSHILLLILTPLAGLAGGWLGHPNKTD